MLSNKITFPKETTATSVINWFSRQFGPCDSQSYSQIRDWAIQIVGNASSSNEKFFASDITPDFNECVFKKTTYRTNFPVWIGEGSSRFADRGLAEIRTHTSEGLNLARLQNVSAFYFLDFGFVFFDYSLNVIETISTPYWPFIVFLDFDVRYYLSGAELFRSHLVFIGDKFSSPNYAHWLLDLLPRTKSLKNFSENRKALLGPILHNWQSQMLSVAGIDSASYISLDSGMALRIHNLFLHSDSGLRVPHPCVKSNLDAVNFVRSLNRYSFDVQAANEVVIVDRKINRKIKNIKSLCDALEMCSLHPRVVFLEDYSVAAQWQLFTNAKYVIGVHGAGMASTIFVRPQSLIFEILSPSYHNPAFFMISSCIQAAYYGVTNVDVEHNDDTNFSGLAVRPSAQNVILSSKCIDSIVFEISSNLLRMT